MMLEGKRDRKKSTSHTKTTASLSRLNNYSESSFTGNERLLKPMSE